ncbi:MAG: site-2 protease family protein [Clostridiales bacterium]|nr:site-2 protease family protein [Clostridiales bacterium]
MLITILDLIGQGYTAQEIIFYVFIMLFALLISFSFHEFMHAYVATILGDPTPGDMGRVTLNPLAHIDPSGAVLILLAGFGWGKPVVYNPRKLTRLQSKTAMEIMVALAGVTGNFIIALICTIGAAVVAGTGAADGSLKGLYLIFMYTSYFSLMLLGFNLIPLPPLDGYQVLHHIVPVKVRYTRPYQTFENIAPKLLLVLFGIGFVTRISVLSILVNLIKWPFEKLLELIFNLIVGLF